MIAILGVNSGLGSSDFTLAPSLVRELNDPSEAWRKVLESFRAVATGDDAALRITYAEARILEAAGRFGEAASRLRELVEETPDESIVLLALARCL